LDLGDKAANGATPTGSIRPLYPNSAATETRLADEIDMARYDFRSPRLFVAAPLRLGATVPLDAAQGHYLTGVLRLQAGDPVLVFNGKDGEWQAKLAGAGRRTALGIEHQMRPQSPPGDLHYLFAPLKRTRLDYMVQKAVEMGVSRLQPVMTRHTQAERVNLDRMHANAVEAAEQCGILAIPEIAAPVALERAIAALEPQRHLVFCDEDAPGADPVAALVRDLGQGGTGPGTLGPGTLGPGTLGQGISGQGGTMSVPLALLIGPEGGFDEEERAFLRQRPHTSRIALGPRILRADTAAVAALAIVQAAAGDWRNDPEAGAGPK
jgi:16S rRNA (uracil1498-N3)-methyltransferase